MKNQFLNFITTIIIAFTFSLFMPWWSVMLAAFIAALIFPLKRAAVFFVPFVAILAFWCIQAFSLANGNDFVLAKKIAVLFPLGGNEYLLLLVTGIVGGLAAGVAGIFGKQCKNVLK